MYCHNSQMSIVCMSPVSYVNMINWLFILISIYKILLRKQGGTDTHNVLYSTRTVLFHEAWQSCCFLFVFLLNSTEKHVYSSVCFQRLTRQVDNVMGECFETVAPRWYSNSHGAHYTTHDSIWLGLWKRGRKIIMLTSDVWFDSVIEFTVKVKVLPTSKTSLQSILLFHYSHSSASEFWPWVLKFHQLLFFQCQCTRFGLKKVG